MANRADVERWRRLAETHAGDGQWQRARFLYELVLESDATDASARFELARVWFHLKEWDRATAILTSEVPAGAAGGRWHDLLGQLLLERQQWTAAVEAFDAALRADLRQ